jgi:aspartyl-tRNA(Asn)/glutamyl-tRNA(Gln) amidotransferase subunit B
MRSKEFATDYRYFPEPDLVPIEATGSWVEGLRAELPELPAEQRARLAEEGVPLTGDGRVDWARAGGPWSP